MLYYTVYSREITIDSNGVTLFTKDLKSYISEKSALIYAIIKNFKFINNTNNNRNVYFKDTPKGKLFEYKFIWENANKISSFEKLYDYNIRILYRILYIQRSIIRPNVNKKSPLYSHTYVSLKRYFYKMLDDIH